MVVRFGSELYLKSGRRIRLMLTIHSGNDKRDAAHKMKQMRHLMIGYNLYLWAANILKTMTSILN